MAKVIERNECSRCGEPAGVCLCEPGVLRWKPLAEPTTARYVREEYLLALLKAARAVLDDLDSSDNDGPAAPSASSWDGLEAAVLWCESDGLGPQALSGAGQLELEES